MKPYKTLIINSGIFIFILLVIMAGGIFLIQSPATIEAAATDDISPPIIFNVNISDVLATSSVITWETDEEADSLVNYGLNKNYGVIRDPRADKLDHRIILENLGADTTYFFRITSSDDDGNQGISQDFSFITPKTEDIPQEGYAIEVIEEGEGGLSEYIIEEGEGGLSEQGVVLLLALIENITSEEVIEEIDEEIKEKAEEIILPPTIILDYAEVEVGTDWAIIRWKTDKKSDSHVALASDNRYDPNEDDPYTWGEGNPDELVLEHEIEIAGLSPATIYHFQVSSESSIGLRGRSQDRTFKTKSVLPEIYNIQISKIEEESATIRWVTNVPCSSIVEFTNLSNNEAKLEGNSSYLAIHTMRLTNLIFDTYYSFMIRVESEDGEKAESAIMTFITTRDEYPPVISRVNTESTLYPGTDNKVQTIASWDTDEAASCQLFYHQGLYLLDEASFLPKEEDLGTRHVQVITNFAPSTVYKFWIICEDEAENPIKSQDYTMLTPSQEESIIDIIIKNFESSFGWLKKIKL